jgi:hypothetical protein
MEKRIGTIEQRITDLERTITNAHVRQAPSAPAERVLSVALRTRSLLLTRCDVARAELEQEAAQISARAPGEPRS